MSSGTRNDCLRPGANGRVSGLDALRGIAALGVVIYHYTSYYRHEWGHADSFHLSFVEGAWGVQLFFMISGFVILMSLERSRSVADFSRSRFLRLFPTYWFCLLVTLTVIATIGIPGEPAPLIDSVVNVTMCQGFFGYRNVDGQYWTLHVELCFYLLMAAIYASGARDYVVPILFALAILGLLNSLGGWGSEWPGVWRLERAWPLRRHLMFFLFGVLVYKARERLTQQTVVWLLMAATILLTVESSRMVLLVMGLFCLGVWMPTSGRLFKPLLFLGTISYSLYLIHANVGYALISMAYQNGVPPQFSVPSVLLFILLLATGVTFFVERPTARLLRNHSMAAKSTAAPTATAS